jgi:hypothetical protein
LGGPVSSEWQRSEQTRCGEDHSELIPRLDRARLDHADSAWLPAWAAWVELSTHDSPQARQLLEAAIEHAPRTRLFHRALILAQIHFGTTSEDLAPLLARARAQVPSAEWDLWEAWARRVLGWGLANGGVGPGESTSGLLDRAVAECGPGSGLEALAQAVRAHLAHQDGLPFDEEWLPSRAPLVHWLRTYPRLGRGEEGELSPEAWILGFRPADLVGMLRLGAPPLTGGDFPTRFEPDLSHLLGVAADFNILGDPQLLRFAEGGVFLVPAPGDLEDQRDATPGLRAVPARLPGGPRWELEAELSFEGNGDYGCSLRLGPFTLVQDHALRLELGSYAKEVPAATGWRRLRLRRDGELFEAWLDGTLQLRNRLPAQPEPLGLDLGRGAPKADVVLGLRGLRLVRED